jgi:hypothetical protein
MKKVKIATVLEIKFDLICLLCPVRTVESRILRKPAIFLNIVIFPGLFCDTGKLFHHMVQYSYQNLSVAILRQKN